MAKVFQLVVISQILAVARRLGLIPKMRLLIVEGDADLLDPVVEVCERFAFEVFGACSAERALEILEEARIDAVLSDIRMHPMSGFQLLETARLKWPHLPFILWTGYWDQSNEERAEKYNNIEKLEKPFTFKELEAVLNRVREKTSLESVHAIDRSALGEVSNRK